MESEREKGKNRVIEGERDTDKPQETTRGRGDRKQAVDPEGGGHVGEHSTLSALGDAVPSPERVLSSYVF